MKQLRTLGLASVATVLLGSTAAQALTPADVWTAMKTRLTSMGQTISVGSQSEADGKLALRNVTGLVKKPNSTVSYAIPEIDLQQDKDGSVTVTLSPETDVVFSTTSPQGTVTEGTLKLTQDGLKSVVAGTDADMTYTTSATSVGVALAGLKSGGKDQPVKVDGKILGIQGTAHIVTNGATDIDSSGSAASANFTVDATTTDKTGSATIHVDFATKALATEAKTTVPAGVNMQDIAAALGAGYAANTTISYGPTTYAISRVGGPSSGTLDGKVDAGTIHVTMDKGHLQYDTDSKGLDLNVTAPVLPVPSLGIKLAESAFRLLMPVEKADAPQPFGLLLKLDGLEISKELWGMFDPKSILPHDPATLILDLAGKGNWAYNFFDPALQKSAPVIPGQVDEVSLNQLKLDAVGTHLIGTGTLKIDNSDPAVPKPDGAINLTLTGANGLLDKLGEMGLLPKEQGMAARMMLGLFARPGGGPDVLTSQLEFKPDGSILANGQRIK
ncbi:MAG: DUF2125 domain-containing protein [Paracoccaceae bacterium]|nr:DUF2125 domain-containing protein [Paracoccaceae bacterium]